MRKTSFFLCLLLSIVMACGAYGQEVFGENVLDEEPYFARHNGKTEDMLFLRDIRILKRFGRFEGLDSAFLKAAILGNIMIEQVRLGKPATYRTVIDYVSNFRQTEAYQQFAEGITLFKKLQDKKVNPDNWDEDKALFVRLGFTEADLDDFRNYIGDPVHKDLTYKQAYAAYMKEIESLSPKTRKSR